MDNLKIKFITVIFLLSSLFIFPSCGPGITIKKRLDLYGKDKSWEKEYTQSYRFKSGEYIINVFFGNILLHHTMFYLGILPMSVTYNDDLTVFFLIDKNGKRLNTKNLKLSSSFIKVGTNSNEINRFVFWN